MKKSGGCELPARGAILAAVSLGATGGRTKRLLAAVGLSSALLVGCATESMKSTPYYTGHDVRYTGDAEDRVNLWPLAYWREPVGSVLWPMLSFSDDHFAFRPLYSQWKRGGKWSEYNFLWPLCQFDTRRDSHRIFPFFWGHDAFCAFPFVWYGKTEGFSLFPLLFWNGRRDSFTLFPLYWHRPETECLFPLWYHDEQRTLVTPLAGWNRDGDSWLFPLYGSFGNDFASPLWMQSRSDGRLDFWLAPPLLSWGERSGESWSSYFLLGLGGRTATSRWLFPVFYDDEQTFASPLVCRFGKNSEDDSWFVPPLLAAWGRDSFASPLWIRDEDENFIPPLLTGWGRDFFASPLWIRDGEECFIPPLLTGWGEDSFASPLWIRDGKECFIPPLLTTWDEDSFASPLWIRDGGDHVIPWLLSAWNKKGVYALCGLGGWKEDGTSWAFPFYWRGGKHGDFRSLLAGRVTGSDRAWTWWLTPLVGTKSGRVSGGWVFPLVNATRDPEFDELERLMNADRLDAAVTGEYRDEVTPDGGRWKTNRVFSVAGRMAANETSLLLGLGGSRRKILQVNNPDNRLVPSWCEMRARNSVEAMAGDRRRRTEERGKTVSYFEQSGFGNILLFKRTQERGVSFDYDTKEKIFDGSVTESGALLNFLWHAKHEKIAGGHDYSKRSVLWRLWHRESLDGDTTTDVFPFITVDSRKNGFSKASFLWRFFRYERDPEKGTKVDLLFVPVWR